MSQARGDLLRAYKRMQNGDIDFLEEQLSDISPDLFEEAVRGHINDPDKGAFAPLPGDLRRQIGFILNDREDAQQRRVAADNEAIIKAQAAAGEGGRDIPLPEFLAKQLGRTTIRVTNRHPDTCADCNDSGWARFYFDRADRTRVWEGREWLRFHASDPAAALKLDCGSAICTCAVGNPLRRLPKQPRLGRIKALARRRRALDDLNAGVQLEQEAA